MHVLCQTVLCRGTDTISTSVGCGLYIRYGFICLGKEAGIKLNVQSSSDAYWKDSCAGDAFHTDNRFCLVKKM